MVKRLLFFVLVALMQALSVWAYDVPGYGDIELEKTWVTSSGLAVNNDLEDLNWEQCDYYVWYNYSKGIAIIRYVNYKHLSTNTTYTIPSALVVAGKSHKVVGLWKLDNRKMILDEGRITTLKLPEGLQFIKGNSAIDLANITSLTLPSSLTWLSSGACKAPKVTSLTLKDSTTPLTIDGFEGYTYGVFGYMKVATATIGRSLVSQNRPFGCNDEEMTLQTLTLTGKAQTIMEGLCYGQRKLTTVTMQEGVTKIGKNAFRDCGKLAAITIPNSVKTIANSAFEGDTLMTKLDLGSGVKYIEDFAFSNCKRVPSLTLPASLDSIDNHAFQDMTGVKTFTIEDSNRPLLIKGWTSFDGGAFKWFADGFTATMGRNINLNGYKDAKANPPFSYSGIGQLTMTLYVSSLNDDEFLNCGLLKNATLSQNITDIPKNAFRNNIRLTGIAIPNKVTHIGRDAFSCDSMMTTLSLINGIKYIEDYAFYGCKRVPSLTLPASLDSIDNHAFQEMTGVKKLTIEDSSRPLLIKGWTSFDGGAFKWFADGFTATMGRNFDLNGYGTSVANPPFSYSGVSQLAMSNYVTRLNNDEFLNCGLLKNATLSQSIKDIPQNAFRNDTLLTGIAIPDKVTHIGRDAFSCDSMMTTLTMSKGIKYIEDYAFYGCKRVPSLTLPASLDSIDNRAFQEMTGVKKLTIEDSTRPLLIKGWTSYTHGAFGWFADGFTATMGRNFDLNGYGNSVANPPFRYSGVSRLTMSNYVTRLNNDEFLNCGLLKNATLSHNIKEIPQNAFRNDTLLTGIVIPDMVMHIGRDAFSCDSMMTTLTMSKGVKYIEDYAFYGCKRVPSLTLPASLDSIDNRAFQEMTGVKTLTIEDSTRPLLIKGWTSYTHGAFGWFANGFAATMGRNFNLNGYNNSVANPPLSYSAMGTLTIGSRVGRFNENEFANCEQLTKITSKATIVPQCPNKNVFNKVNKSIPVYVPNGTINKYKAALGWMDFFNYHEDDGGKPGDITGDGFIDVDDMNIIINIMVKKNGNPAYESAADLNHDGVVDIDDLNIVINIMVGKG